MTTDKRPFEEMNAIAKQIKEQTLVATDDYFKFLKKTISSHPARVRKLVTLEKPCRKEHRIGSGIHAQTQRSEGFFGRFPSANRIHAVTIRRIGEQTKTLSEACGKSAARVFNSSFKNVA